MWHSLWKVSWMLVLIGQFYFGQVDLPANAPSIFASPAIASPAMASPASSSRSAPMTQPGSQPRSQPRSRQSVAYPEPPDVYDYESMRQAEKEIYGEDDPGWSWGKSGDVTTLAAPLLGTPPPDRLAR
jgi:hypothetical protein